MRRTGLSADALRSPLNGTRFRSTAPLSLSKLGKSRSFTARSITQSHFDVHFLIKEPLYTKLKYSRCPQYDIVSGGFAALLAGFIGFLISEKFGIELVDSADFYNAFMYGVFISFSLRPLIRIYSKDEILYHPLSPKYLLIFTRDSVIMLLRSATSILRHVRNFLF